MSGRILEPGQIEAAANIPPLFNLPLQDLFSRRAARLRELAPDNPLQGYLELIAGVCDAQQVLLDRKLFLPTPDAAALARSQEHRMPPLAYEVLVREGAWLPLLDAFLDAYELTANPAVVEALKTLRNADSGQRKAWALGLLNGQFDLLPPAWCPSSAPYCRSPSASGCCNCRKAPWWKPTARPSARPAARRRWPG